MGMIRLTGTPRCAPGVFAVREAFRNRAAFAARKARARASAWDRITHGLARRFHVRDDDT